MTIEEVLRHFRSAYGMEKDIKMAHQNINNWKKYGYIPISTQQKIERLTKGKLKASLDHCKKNDD